MNFNCVVCATPLQGNLDTYGDVNFEMCWDCWSSLLEDMNPTPYTYIPDETQEALPLLDEEMEKWL